MSHPHNYLLLELDIAIKKLPPTLSVLKQEAEKKREAFEADPTTSEDVILGYLAELGRKEYPHRHALIDLHDQFGDTMELSLILEHLDSSVAEKVKPMIESGVNIEALVKSDWFEQQLNPAERYQVEDGILLARYKIEQEDKGLVEGHAEVFQQLLATWEARAKEIEAQIEELESLADKDPRYTDEINDQVRNFRVGWSVVERDPELEAVKSQVQQWKAVFEDETSGT